MRPACVEPVHRHSWSAAGRVPWPSRLIELSAVVQANPQSNTNDGDVPLRHTTVLAAGAPLHLDGRAGRVLRPIRGPYQSGRQRIPVKGEIPNPIDPPPGCAFNPRCPLAFDLCRRQAPALIDGVACHAVNNPAEAAVAV